jgi:hypothetical protein
MQDAGCGIQVLSRSGHLRSFDSSAVSLLRTQTGVAAKK